MRSLLDVNVLIALFDQQHIFHEQTRTWLTENIEEGWASCPITQAGFIRIFSHPHYPNGVSTTQAARLLSGATADAHHAFWPDELSLVSQEIRWDRVLGPSQVTDVYLLALAVAQGGRFVTFDRKINVAAVPRASSRQLLIL